MQEQIHAFHESSARRQIHPFGFHRQMKAPRCRVSGCRNFFTRDGRSFEVEANGGTLSPKHGYASSITKRKERFELEKVPSVAKLALAL